MSENYRKDVAEYTDKCMPNQKGPSQRVYRPHSMRQVSACKELNRLKDKLTAITEQIESERFNTKRVGLGNVIHNILDDFESILEQK